MQKQARLYPCKREGFCFALGISQKPIQLEWDSAKEGDSARLPVILFCVIPPRLRNPNSHKKRASSVAAVAGRTARRKTEAPKL